MPDRIIRESICMSDTLNLLSDFEERFWHRLIVNCDDFGRFDARPAVLKGRLFPLLDGKTKKDMADALRKLASVGLVELYEVEGRPFLHVVTWSKYQRTRANKSKFPAPADACRQLTADVPVFESECDMRNSICGDEGEGETRGAVAAVMRAYREKISPQISGRSQEELAGFVEAMGPECCLRAIDIALDANKAGWPYIRGILRSKQAQGVRSLADWDSVESRHGSASRGPAGPYSPPPDAGREDPARMQDALARMKRFQEQLHREAEANAGG